MPRPGPRPYECVRRAWHSDRHQPMRGSIIRQILRLAIEAHSTATKKNSEWQDKILIVIVKAEEIMYSKANSEAEYMNPETLWDRVNDAINTIIRRDESTETGELLPPCVEAALNLGCHPVRASRSQRHCNPRTYLTPRAQEPDPPPRILEKVSDERCPHLSPVQSGGQFARIASNVNTNISVSQTNRHGYPFLSEDCPSGHDQLMRIETNSQPNLGQVYPLYYGTHFQNAESQTGSPVLENIVSETVIVGRPIGTSIGEPGEMGSLRNLFSSSDVDVGGKRIGQPDIRHTNEKSFGTECDLSLRLGPTYSDHCVQVEKNSICETEDVGPSSCQHGVKVSEAFQQKSKEFHFFPQRTVNDHFEYFSRKWFIESEGHNLGATMRKRKVTFGGNSEDQQFRWQAGPSSNNGRNGPGAGESEL